MEMEGGRSGGLDEVIFSSFFFNKNINFYIGEHKMIHH